jgi:hypothetical protein
VGEVRFQHEVRSWGWRCGSVVLVAVLDAFEVAAALALPEGAAVTEEDDKGWEQRDESSERATCHDARARGLEVEVRLDLKDPGHWWKGAGALHTS